MAKCGNSKCNRSTGFTGEITFGSGMIDDYGYWQFPCRICAEDFDSRVEEIRQEIRDQLTVEKWLPLNIAQYVVDQDWLNQPAWPTANQNVEKLIEDGKDYYAHLAAENARIDQEMAELFQLEK